ncbi:acyl-CoA carboxylase subunit epsilon [Streptomyces sp. IBSNAI002]|uniref:acyl-CoA carboxylase subunit epsilon n=1 Tax=Streptomyces sp. IBSNAI002 TaxID=3457500 RepID=UPI003FD4752D
MPNDVPISSLLRVERGHADPEELAAIAVVVACYAGRTSLARAAEKCAGPEPGRSAGHGTGRRRAARSDAGCWAGCWACR